MVIRLFNKKGRDLFNSTGVTLDSFPHLHVVVDFRNVDLGVWSLLSSFVSLPTATVYASSSCLFKVLHQEAFYSLWS